jgi:hypothetical protein
MLEIVLAEFNGQFKPNIENIKKYFPEAEVNVYSNGFDGPFKKGDERYGNRMNDYWKVRLLLSSKADIAISLDADVLIVSDKVRAITPLVNKFGLCLPANPRKLVYVDTMIGADSDRQLDDTEGMGYAMNMTPIAFNTKNLQARRVLEAYIKIMETNPVRGPLAMWRAVYQTGFYPCILPPQWCVCKSDVNVDNAIIAHIGHDIVRARYS